MSIRFPEHSPIVFSSTTPVLLGGEPLAHGVPASQQPEARSPLCAEDPNASRNGCFYPNHSSAPFHRGRRSKTCGGGGWPALCAFCALLPGSCQWRGAPIHTGAAPRQAPSLGREEPTRRDSASTLNSDTSRPSKRSGAGLGFSGASRGRCGATCALRGPQILRVQLRPQPLPELGPQL